MIINDLYNNKKQGVAEGRMVKGPGGVPLDRQGRPVPPKVKPIRMQKWLVTHSGPHGEGGKDIIEAPNFETAWEIANEYDLDIIDVKPYRGPARPTLVDEGVAEGYDSVKSDYGHWEEILEKDGYRFDSDGARALRLVAGDYRGPDGYVSTIRNILTYVKQNRAVLGKAVSDYKTVKDCKASGSQGNPCTCKESI